MRRQMTMMACLGLAMAAPAAWAADGDRYVLEKSADGFVRMDRQTGEMSICQERSGQLVCKLAADERTAFQDEVDRLQADVKALDARVGVLENSLAAKLEQALPSDEQIDRTLSTMERFMRGFFGMVKEFEKEQEEPGQPSDPQKT